MSSWKMAPQILGLVRADVPMRRDGKGKSKHRANVRAIIAEAFKIDYNGHTIDHRKSASVTYDQKRTKYNRYTGSASAGAVIAMMEAEADAAKTKVTLKNGTVKERGLRSDAVVGIAVIYNPPAEATEGWTDDDYARFYTDCRTVMAEISPLFNQDNIRATAEHFDEGPPVDDVADASRHVHDILVPRDIDGQYRGNVIDALFLSEVNKKFPAGMRTRGWDMLDLDVTEWELFREKSAKGKTYKEERKSKLRKSGLSNTRYLERKSLENIQRSTGMVRQAEELVQAAKAGMEDAVRLQEEAEAYAGWKVDEAEKVAGDIERAAKRKAAWIKTQAEEEARKAQAQAESARAEQRMNIEQAEAVKAEREKAEAERLQIEREVQEIAENAGQAIVEAETECAMLERETLDRIAESELEMRIAVAEASAAVTEAMQNREFAKMGLSLIMEMQSDIQADIDLRNKKLEAVKKDLASAESERDAIREEVKGLRAELEAEAREAWNNWLDAKKKALLEKWNIILTDAENTAKAIIAAATDKAEGMAQGEYAFLVEWLGGRRCDSGPYAGKTELEAVRDEYARKRAGEIRRDMFNAIPDFMRNIGLNRKQSAGKDYPGT